MPWEDGEDPLSAASWTDRPWQQQQSQFGRYGHGERVCARDDIGGGLPGLRFPQVRFEEVASQSGLVYTIVRMPATCAPPEPFGRPRPPSRSRHRGIVAKKFTHPSACCLFGAARSGTRWRNGGWSAAGTREKSCNGLRALSRAASGRREPETRVVPNKGSWGSGSPRVGEGIRFGYYPPPRRDPSPSFPPRRPLSQDNAALLAVTQYHSTCTRPSLYFGPCRLSPALLTPACSPPSPHSRSPPSSLPNHHHDRHRLAKASQSRLQPPARPRQACATAFAAHLSLDRPASRMSLPPSRRVAPL